MKHLLFSAGDFADYLIKYEDGNECNAFFKVVSKAAHQRRLDEAEELMKIVQQVLCCKAYSSIEELLITLELNTGHYRISKRFWLDVLKDIGASSLDHWIVEDLTRTVVMTIECLNIGVFDYQVKLDDLFDFLTKLNSASNISSGDSILAISDAWCKRKKHLEAKKPRKKKSLTINDTIEVFYS